MCREHHGECCLFGGGGRRWIVESVMRWVHYIKGGKGALGGSYNSNWDGRSVIEHCAKCGLELACEKGAISSTTAVVAIERKEVWS